MRKQIWLIIILGIIIVVLAGAVIFWPQNNNQQNNIQQGTEGLTINSPKANEEILSPFKISGTVSTSAWAPFEAQVGTVRLLDSTGKELAFGILTSKGEWMQLPSNFETTLNFVPANAGPATLVFKNENASGDPQRDKTFSLPVKIKASGETMTVKAFFGKNEITGSTCSVVFPVDRVVSKTQAVARAALEELLKGPTEAEKAQGYFSNINPGVKIQSLTIDSDGTARADFSSELETTGGSCRVTEIRSEINFTLKQFPTIKSVIISINGESETILQP